MPIPLLSVIPAAFQAITGIGQMLGGKSKLDNLVRPTYEIPQEVDNMLSIAATQYQDPYTAAQTNAARNIGASGANAVTMGRDSGNLGAILPGIVAQQSAGYNNLAAQMDEQKAKQRAVLTDMLGVKAKYQDQKWQMNEYAPYQEAYNEGREQVGAGQQNVFGALNSIASIGTMAASMRGSQPTPGQMAPVVSQNVGAAGSVQGAMDAFGRMSSAGQAAGANTYNYLMGGLTAGRQFPY